MGLEIPIEDYGELKQEIESLRQGNAVMIENWKTALKERDEWQRRCLRSVTLAIKHCPRDHHDWAEITKVSNAWFV